MKRIVAAIVTLFLVVAVAVADETLSSGLTLTIPSQGARNWGTTFKNSFAQKISEHDHTGSGKGLQISTNALATNSVTGAKIRLANDEYLKARNAANSADLSILKINSSNKIRFDAANISADTAADLGAQPLDSDLTAIAALTTTTAGRALLDDADAAAQRTTLTAAKSGDNTDITKINQSTSDGSDSLLMQFGHTAASRGATLTVTGNENAATGQAILATGDVSGGHMSFITRNADSDIKFQPGGAGAEWIMKASGDLLPTNAEDIGSTAKPVGNVFIANTSHSPTLTAASGTTSSSTSFWSYYKIGKRNNFNFRITIRPSSASAYLEATLPATAASLGGAQGGVCYGVTGTLAVGYSIAEGASSMTLVKTPSATWASGTDWTIQCNGSYEEA